MPVAALRRRVAAFERYIIASVIIFRYNTQVIQHERKVISLLQVTRKDDRESLENMIRRFNKKVQQSGVLGVARRKRAFEKPLTKRATREIAIRKSSRKAAKARQALYR